MKSVADPQLTLPTRTLICTM